MAEYEIYALKYAGPFVRTGAHLMWYQDWDRIEKINYYEDWPSALIVDLVGWMKTYDKLRERVSSPDLLFPGHDRLLMENYPEAAKDITRLV